MKKEIWVFMQGRVLGIVVHFWNHRRTKSPDLHKAEGTFFWQTWEQMARNYNNLPTTKNESIYRQYLFRSCQKLLSQNYNNFKLFWNACNFFLVFYWNAFGCHLQYDHANSISLSSWQLVLYMHTNPNGLFVRRMYVFLWMYIPTAARAATQYPYAI